MKGTRHLVIGGARSGKSRYAMQTAQHLAGSADSNAISELELVYVATATAEDQEMAERIQHHQRQRNSSWQLIEEPIALAEALRSCDGENKVILVDCLTLWLSNCLARNCWIEEKAAALACLSEMQAQVVLVNNETGLGIVPMGQLTRQFVDENGFLNQDLAQVCDKVVIVVAGIPQVLKS